MFREEYINIGSESVLSVRNAQGTGIELSPQQGGVINQLYLGEQATPVLLPFSDGEDLILNPRYKQTMLFPFPSRLANGQFEYQGNKYQFPLNEPDRNNALHGFVYNKQFELTNLQLGDDHATIELIYRYGGSLHYYPFPFQLNLQYKLSKNEFALHFAVINSGTTTLPYGFGWHPYFSTDASSKLRLPPAQIQHVDNRLLPTGSQEFHSFGDQLVTIKEKLDNAFRLQDTVELNIEIGEFGGQRLRLVGDSGFRFFQVYNPDTTTVAVEPVTSNINVFNNNDGLLELEAGASKIHSCRLVLS